MKLITLSVVSFAVALLAAAFTRHAPALQGGVAGMPPFHVGPSPDVTRPARALDPRSRAALAQAERELASALKVRSEAEAVRSAARSRVISAREAFEASMLDLTTAERVLQAELAGSPAAEAATHAAHRAREASEAAELRLREALEGLDRAEDAYDAAQAATTRARVTLQAITARGQADPALLDAA